MEQTAHSPDSQIDDPVFDSEYRSPPYTDTTPSSELSPPDSPASKNAALAQDKRGNARRLAASLSLEEQVSLSAPIFAAVLVFLIRDAS